MQDNIQTQSVVLVFVSDKGQSQSSIHETIFILSKNAITCVGGDRPRCTCATEYSPPFLTVQAEDYDSRIAGLRREERLRRMEEQMRSTQGFRGEGQTLRG